MSIKKIPMTAVGAAALRTKLEQLKRVERPQLIRAIAEARAHGDLKENAEYHTAKDRQGFIEAQIRNYESKLLHVQVIDVSSIKNEGRIVFGARVTILEDGSDKAISYQIVGEDEADLKQQKISIVSPLARALIGKYVGDEVTVATPSGELVYVIQAIDYY